MKQLFPRGKRIRPTDKDLVFHTALAALFPVFLLIVLLFHIRQIAGTNWQEVSLSQIIQDVNIPYLLFSMGVAGLVCLTAVPLFWRYRRDEVKQLIHRQKLARMVLENKWYESEQKRKTLFQGLVFQPFQRNHLLLSKNLLPDETGLAPYLCGNHLGEISGAALKLGEKAGKRLVL